jgi:HlyD family secretion protein
MRRNTIALAAACMMALALMTGGCRRGPEQKKVEETGVLVETAAATTRDMEEIVSVTGTIRAYKDVTLVSEVNAIVSRVAAREGDRVRAGQVVIQLDTKDATSRVQQAQAALASAQAMANQAQTGLRLQETQTSTSIQQAQAGLSAARDGLRMLETGARPQERLVAEAAVRQAQAGYDKAKKDLARAESLFKQGAIAEQQVDAARTGLEVVAATLDSAKQQLSLVREGPRTEQIEVARSQVRQAEEALRLAKAGRAQVEMRRAEVKTAQAAVGQARATLDYALQQLAKTSITSPIDGVVYARKAEPGEVAGGFPMMMIADLRSLYFEASASELQVAGLSPGDRVIVSVDGLPRRRFEGRIEKVVPVATPGTRNFMVRIQVDNPSGLLRPGMFARGEAVVARHANAVVVPSEAVITAGARPAVFVVEDGVAHRREVALGVVASDVTEIEKGVRRADQVVVVGQQVLSDGERVRLPRKTGGGSSAEAKG